MTIVMYEIHTNKDIYSDMMMLKGERINKGATMSHRWPGKEEKMIIHKEDCTVIKHVGGEPVRNNSNQAPWRVARVKLGNIYYI